MEFYGLIGEKLSHSLSPKIHKKVFKLLSIEGGYKLFEIPKYNIKNLGLSLKTLGIKGVNVTIPYKKEVLNQLDYISNEAKHIGAINTIKLVDNKLYGYNTDYFGFGMLLEVNEIEVKDKVVVVLGNGGASKAINAYLLDNNVKKLYLVTRNKSKKIDLDKKIEVIDYRDLESIIGDVIINTTPVGMYPKVDISPVDENIMRNFKDAVDIIYNPSKTKFIKIAEKLENKACNGLYMLVGQAIKSQEIWQDINIDKKIIDNIYGEIEKEF